MYVGVERVGRGSWGVGGSRGREVETTGQACTGLPSKSTPEALPRVQLTFRVLLSIDFLTPSLIKLSYISPFPPPPHSSTCATFPKSDDEPPTLGNEPRASLREDAGNTVERKRARECVYVCIVNGIEVTKNEKKKEQATENHKSERKSISTQE